MEHCNCDQQTIFRGNTRIIEGRTFFICYNCDKPISLEEEGQCNITKDANE